jgi:pantetheine-phosphate adenylyltransferase
VARVLYPGSFDPLHNGHLEIIETAGRLFDRVVVAAMVNPQKGAALFTLEEREAMLAESLAHLDNVEIVHFSGLVVDLAAAQHVDFIVKGLRALSDFEAEMQMAQMNQAVSGINTVFLPSASEHAFVASKYIRDFARYGGDVSHMVPGPVARRLKERTQK